MATGSIFDIQPFSVYDGPGIRTTVFFKGCNLKCKWCHNPESWDKNPQLLFYPEKCIGCGTCYAVCPENAHVNTELGHVIDRGACTLCGLCAAECYAGALKISGQTMTAEQVWQRIASEKAYYRNSAGGVTFSGGEPLLQTAFLKELLSRCKAEGIHTAVDTAGGVPYASFEEILPDTDLFLYDIKAASNALHKELTGIGNSRIWENLERLAASGKAVWVRVPCIPGGNLHEMKEIARQLAGLPIKQVELLAYHPMGAAKSAALSQTTAAFTVPSKQTMLAVKEEFVKQNLPVIYKE